MPSALGLTEPLSELVRAKYKHAQTSGGLLFSPTHANVTPVNGMPFQVRWCPALAKKPPGEESGNKPPQDDPGTQKFKKFDPFEKPSPDLLIGSVPADNPTHNLVLNKYPVIPCHWILSTIDFKEQSDGLVQRDLAVMYACLQAWEDGRLFAFFNSGEHSGASQRHSHIQFLPIEGMQLGPDNESWRPLIDYVQRDGTKASTGTFSLKSLPFAHFSLPIPANPTPSVLFHLYTSLHEPALAALQSSKSAPTLAEAYPESKPKQSAMSYNLAMTSSSMLICPRTSEGGALHEPGYDSPSQGRRNDSGKVSVNGTVLAGTIMVREEAQWEALKGEMGEGLLRKVLEDVGVPQRHGMTGDEEKL